MAVRHIYLVRHAQREPTTGPDEFGPGLSLLGWKQAHLTARRLARLKIDVIHTSSLRRTMETARIIAVEFPDVPIHPSSLLWECIPAMPDFAVEWHKAHPNVDTDAIKIPPEVKPWVGLWDEDTSVKEIEDGFEQARQAWLKYFVPSRGKDRHDIIVCHGNILRYFVMRALIVPPEAWQNTDMYNCGLSEIVIEGDGRIMLLSHNDHGHLMPEGMKTLF
jgi:serine/threonine-protein phosphatase PGAM5